MVMSPQVRWLLFKAVRAGLAVKRPYLSKSYGSNEQRGKTANRPWPRRVAFKMGRGRVARRLRPAPVFDNRRGKPERHNRKNWCGMRSRALPTTHFERNGITIICETVR
jgi:hypothetical protein